MAKNRSSTRRARKTVSTIAAVATFALIVAACSSSTSSSPTPSATPIPTPTATADAGGGGGKHHSEASRAELEKWQKDLNAVGCYVGKVDGLDGPATERGIKEFQAAAGLTVDGLLGPKTETALGKDAAAGTKVCGGSGTGGSGTDCPGGPNCRSLEINPRSGGPGTTINVRIEDASSGGCGDSAYLTQSGPDESVASTGPLEGAAGHMEGTLTVPSGTASGTWYVRGSAWESSGGLAVCTATFTVN